MIEIADQSSLASQVVGALLHETFPASYAVVVPPGFGEEQISEAIEQRLCSENRAHVARIALDHIRRPIDYVQDLQRQWSIGQPPKRTDAPTIALERLVGSASPSRPAVQIITRFEKFLDVLDVSMLGKMRSLEAGSRLRSAVITPFRYPDVKRRWIDQGRKLVTSNYGDTHNSVVVRPLEFVEAQRACARLGIPDYVAAYIIEQTGAYPEVCFVVAGAWKRAYEGKPFTHRVKRELAEIAQDRLKRFVEQCDMPDQTVYRSAMVSLHFDSNRDEAVATLRDHPWCEAILKDGELRAEALGPVAVAMVGGVHFDTAHTLYVRGAYRQAVEAMRLGGAPRTCERLLLLHAQAMALLVDPEDGIAGIDTDWVRLGKVLREAFDLMMAPDAGVAPESITRIRERHEQLISSARSIADAGQGGGRRVVDALSSVSPRNALWLVLLEHKRAAGIARNSLATQAALPIPEQVFRLWARWSLELEYEVQPADVSLWDRVRELWPAARIAPNPGAPFASFDAFAWFAMARAERENIPLIARPEASAADLGRALSLLQIRRDQAHAVSRCSDRDRRELFDLISRWTTALLAPCKAHADRWSLNEFEQLVQPLPLLAPDGELEWF
jgi:hypothetical protein